VPSILVAWAKNVAGPLRFGKGLRDSDRTALVELRIAFPDCVLYHVRMSTEVSLLQIPLPDSVSAEEARLMLAVKLYEMDRLSTGQAAEMAGCSQRSFLETLGRHGVPVFRQDESSLAEEAGL
jgi:predicted HTH domain antitoxin